MGYLEQGLSYNKNETIGEFLRLNDRRLEAATEQVEKLARAFATAKAADLAPLTSKYDAALAELNSLIRSRPQPHEAQAVLAGLGEAE